MCEADVVRPHVDLSTSVAIVYRKSLAFLSMTHGATRVKP